MAATMFYPVIRHDISPEYSGILEQSGIVSMKINDIEKDYVFWGVHNFSGILVKSHYHACVILH